MCPNPGLDLDESVPLNKNVSNCLKMPCYKSSTCSENYSGILIGEVTFSLHLKTTDYGDLLCVTSATKNLPPWTALTSTVDRQLSLSVINK